MGLVHFGKARRFRNKQTHRGQRAILSKPLRTRPGKTVAPRLELLAGVQRHVVPSQIKWIPTVNAILVGSRQNARQNLLFGFGQYDIVTEAKRIRHSQSKVN